MEIKKSISIIEFTESIGPYNLDKIALVNANDMSDEEINYKIRSDEYDERIIVMYKSQFEQVIKPLMKSYEALLDNREGTVN